MGDKMNDIGDEIKKWRIEKCFYTPDGIDQSVETDPSMSASKGNMMLGKLMLVVTEISEAAEAVRHNDFDNFKEELADTIIRLLDIARSCGIDIDGEVLKKVNKNKERPIKHGKVTSL